MHMRILSFPLLALALAGCGGEPSAERPAAKIKIGFMVKQPEEPWFQLEWKFAEQAAREKGFDLIKIGATDGEKVLGGIDNLAANGAKGFIICTPDVRLGPAIVARARTTGMKLMSVDDQLVGADGAFLDVPHMGISAREIGRAVGRAILDEMAVRGWNPAGTGAAAMSFDELDTARERTEGAMEALVAGGFPAGNIHRAPLRTTDVPGAFDAAGVTLTQHPDVRRWVAFGLNDEAVLGAVRALEGRGVAPADVIGVGIGGTTGVTEFQKEKPTGFFGSILLAPRRHGYETALLMYEWITRGVEPPKTTLTSGLLITRKTFETVMREQGLLP